MIKIQFILKYRSSYITEYNQIGYISSGLYNSARMVAAALEEYGINGEPVQIEMVQLNSYNIIDTAVFQFNPDIVIIEAFWVPPSKIAELSNLWHHRNRKWIIRNHSEIPFLSLEREPIEWIPQYLSINNNIFVASNSTTSVIDLYEIVAETNNWTIEEARQRIIYFPNYYLIERSANWISPPLSKPYIDIGCFGAMRPLKNHALQAIAALKFARLHDKKLRFHVNGGSIEYVDNSILIGLRSIFNGQGDAEMIEHDWLDHDSFLDLIATMDISMQVSFSETFNIVTADAVSVGVPVVVSNEISWVDNAFKCSTTHSDDIIKKLQIATLAGRRGLQNVNLTNLIHFNKTAIRKIQDAIDYVLQSN